MPVARPRRADDPTARRGVGARLRSAVRGEHARIFGPAAAVIGVRGYGALIAYALQVVLARWLGPEQAGIFVYGANWLLVLGTLAPIGLTVAVVRFVPEYTVQEKWPALRGVLRRTRQIVILSSVAIAAAAVFAVNGLGPWVPEHYRLALTICLAAAPLMALIELHEAKARGFGWIGLAYAPTYAVRPTVFLLLLGAGVVAFGVETGVQAAIVAWVSYALTCAGQILLFDRRVPAHVRTAPVEMHTRHWLRIGLPLLLFEGFHIVFHLADVLIVGMLLPPADVAVYNAAARTAGLVILVFFAVSAFTVPRFAALHGANDRPGLARLAGQATMWTFWPSLAAAVVLLVAGRPLLSVFGPEFVAGYDAMAILIAGALVRAAGGPADYLLNMTGHQDACVKALGPCAALGVALAVALVPLLGFEGAAIAVASSLSLYVLVLVVLVRRFLGITAFMGYARLSG